MKAILERMLQCRCALFSAMHSDCKLFLLSKLYKLVNQISYVVYNNLKGTYIYLPKSNAQLTLIYGRLVQE